MHTVTNIIGKRDDLARHTSLMVINIKIMKRMINKIIKDLIAKDNKIDQMASIVETMAHAVCMIFNTTENNLHKCHSLDYLTRKKEESSFVLAKK